jgi:2-keto-4-pentenoate hydratase
MNVSKVEFDLAARLRAAYVAGPIAPFAEERDIGIDAAYRIQNINTEFAIHNEGREIVGRKIGLTSLAVQAQLGVDQPDFGILFADMAVAAGSSTSTVGLIQPKIEAEIAFGIGRDIVDPGLAEEQLVDSIEWVAAALEIVDSRIADWRIGIAETIADNASSGRFVIGEKRTMSSAIDLTECAMTLSRNGRVESTGKGRDCLGSPIISTLWLARKMIEVGRPLRAGEIILSGALGPMIAMRSGDIYFASVEGVGDVTVSF